MWEIISLVTGLTGFLLAGLKIGYRIGHLSGLVKGYNDCLRDRMLSTKNESGSSRDYAGFKRGR